MPSPPQPPVPLQIPEHIRACIRQSRAYQPQNEPRVIHDLIECCTRYPTLHAIISNFRPQGRPPQRLVALRGTIPIVYKSAPYKIPVHIWVMSFHPIGPPLIYVVPTRSMVFRINHQHVNHTNGFVHLPYLSQWDPLTSTLHACVHAMVQAFSIKPPVYSRDNPPATNREAEKLNLIRSLSTRLANALDHRRRLAEKEVKSLDAHMAEIAAQDDTHQAVARQRSKEHHGLAHTRDVLKAEQTAVRDWLSRHPLQPQDASIDDITIPRTVLSQQSIEATSADAAITDALDQMDEAIDRGVIETETYMREVRKLARLQFFHRATLRKIQLHLGSAEPQRLRDYPIPTTSPKLHRVPHAAFQL